MEINSEEQARMAITEWHELPVRVQAGKIRMAIEKLELNQMYYEQKGNEPGALRIGKYLELLKIRLATIESE